MLVLEYFDRTSSKSTMYLRTTRWHFHFDKDNNIKKLSGRHSKRTKKKDMDAIVKQLSEVSGVFSIKEGRTHRYLKNFKSSSMQTLSMENLKTWMDGQLEKLLLYYR